LRWDRAAAACVAVFEMPAGALLEARLGRHAVVCVPLAIHAHGHSVIVPSKTYPIKLV
jgi:hypothetical protein